ncbi:Hypothetical protein I595_2084 [Croceitalea dokdonensis DOKDO 023]|uniref:Uncharacterized protein n=1 Tax=Croceitalea dokdonensis DOKDO 023 TaxID=1300341 RepID=A0A0P7AUQ2_9FLAO|nr:DUF2911 domain-containing protein [Croceitalea dokdonensis]KPM31590.1 Hypothetical protein I595_2084 [Croceitalea dokdonensis DOKDO 023]
MNVNKGVVWSIFWFLTTPSIAQIVHPKASPSSQVVQEIGLSKIKIDYSRPSAKGRKVMGALVPYGRIWRVGANESTKITMATDIMVLGHVLPKGTYALYAFPQEKEWEIAFHTNTGHWGDGRTEYSPAEDAFRVSIEAEKLPYHQETFLIAFDSITHNSANLNLVWERTKITIPITVDTRAAMEMEIAKQLAAHPTAQTYYEAGRYLQEQGMDLRQALTYLRKALELGGDTYYFHRVKSLLEADLGNYADAIQSAQKSLELANSLKKDEFVRMNQQNISRWQGLLPKK